MKNKTVKQFLLMAMMALFLVACGPKELTWATYENADYGVTMDAPDQWVKRDEEGALFVADSDKTLDTDAKNGGLIMFMDLSEFLELGLTDPLEMIEIMAPALQGDESFEINITSEPEALTLNGQDAAKVDFDGSIEGKVGSFSIYAVKGETGASMVLSGSVGDGSQDEPIQRILDSLVIR